MTLKTATIPAIRVEPELRAAAENALQDGETLSGFVEDALHRHIARRRLQQDFITRGLISRDSARETGHYVSPADIMAELDDMIAAHPEKP
ncbi:YlcI/YnfO family protein [Thalassospira sp.]|uniref:YlcI/YnfO family protein n=1 Tax=Thalassospira sp. TaxID=1912094 RepID=UPI002732EBF0|nr:YlcI/YnfO family protein [Thalassospira sp.]MDP2700362.1 YlcI/YnfO family protein [Thalassospira sp.]